MELKTERCAKCFAPGAEVVSHWAFSPEMAARLYGSVHETGYLPTMCQQHEGHFYVCYARNAAQLDLANWP